MKKLLRKAELPYSEISAAVQRPELRTVETNLLMLKVAQQRYGYLPKFRQSELQQKYVKISEIAVVMVSYADLSRRTSLTSTTKFLLFHENISCVVSSINWLV